MAALLHAYWPALFLLGGLYFATYVRRICQLPSRGRRLLLLGIGSGCLLYLGASVAIAYLERTGGGYPFAYAAIGKLSPASILWALGLAGLCCGGARQLRLRYGGGLLAGALYLVMNAVHLLVPSQGELVETVGLFTARRLPLPGLVEQLPQPAGPRGGRPVVKHGWCTLALTQGPTTTWLFDGLGPFFKLQLPGPFLPVTLPAPPHNPWSASKHAGKPLD